jgi:hypothetical protein
LMEIQGASKDGKSLLYEVAYSFPPPIVVD